MFLHAGFPVILRDEGRSVEETLAMVEQALEMRETTPFWKRF